LGRTKIDLGPSGLRGVSKKDALAVVERPGFFNRNRGETDFGNRLHLLTNDAERNQGSEPPLSSPRKGDK